MLYPPELRALRVRDADGRGRGIRTPDPLLPKQMRYQTAPCPVLLRPAGRRDPAESGPGPHGSANDTDALRERQFGWNTHNLHCPAIAPLVEAQPHEIENVAFSA